MKEADLQGCERTDELAESYEEVAEVRELGADELQMVAGGPSIENQAR